MTSPGYDPEREIVVVAPDGTFVAFCIYWLDTTNKIGLFEPVGVHKDYHRKGIGGAMMCHTMRLMRNAGMTSTIVGHDLDNVASTRLYASLGYVQYCADMLGKKAIAR